jgi:hypothetical protein
MHYSANGMSPLPPYIRQPPSLYSSLSLDGGSREVNTGLALSQLLVSVVNLLL